MARKLDGLPTYVITEQTSGGSRCSTRWRQLVWTAFITLIILVTFYSETFQRRGPMRQITTHATAPSPSSKLASFQNCSVNNFLDTGLPFLETAAALPVDEFVERRNRLAVALHNDGMKAFIVEPGYTFQYYANVSQPQWEVWEPEERPFLMIVEPQEDSTGTITANTSFLVPAFEESRARLLQMPFTSPIQTIPWEEHWNPYTTLLDSGIFSSPVGNISSSPPKVMVDEEMRDFIARGLSSAGFDVHGLAGSVEKVRQTKSAREIGILRAVNTGTVEAIRAMRKCILVPQPSSLSLSMAGDTGARAWLRDIQGLYLGVTESEVQAVLDETLRAAGLEPFFDIVLFDEDAALPHGGPNGTKQLENDAFILIDVGAHLHGYSSDICRTFLPPFSPKPTTEAALRRLSRPLQEKLRVWDIVFEAQTQSLHALRAGSTAASVDVAARKVITDAGYGPSFTHRVGHGIGIKGKTQKIP
ncbi:MAG: hypothetical protein M1819_005086 [Sarea resinae]|nr:MAG: hypothetical protein M1819_005086 [Sarea resinae]